MKLSLLFFNPPLPPAGAVDKQIVGFISAKLSGISGKQKKNFPADLPTGRQVTQIGEDRLTYISETQRDQRETKK